MPSWYAIRVELDRFASITDADVATVMALKRPRQDRQEAETKADGTFVKPLAPETERERLIYVRSHYLDHIFFDYWRLNGGWLTPEERSRVLAIIHDPLAIQMRCAVVSRLYPDEPGLAQTLMGRTL